MASESEMPMIFLTHGAGPCWYMDEAQNPRVTGLGKKSKSADFFRNLVSKEHLPKPNAILVISAHWEEDTCTVLTHSKPPLYFDYYRFPPETYELTWPVPGAPDLAHEVKNLLEENGIPCKEDCKRGLDHGVFVPLKLAYPDADIPVTQLSLKSSLNLDEHLVVGKLLAPLRKKGVLIIGSGAAIHNDDEMKPGDPVKQWAEEFREVINDIVSNKAYSNKEREKKLEDFCSTDLFKLGHPRTEHFIPLPMVMGAVGFSPGKVLYDEIVLASFMQGTYLFK